MGGQEDDVRLAFILTTAFMTFLPLTMVGGVIWWFVRRALERERDHEALRAEAQEAGADRTRSGKNAGEPRRPALVSV